MTPKILYLLVLTFISCTVLFKFILSSLSGKDKFEKRLKKYIDSSDVIKEKRELNQNSLIKRISAAIETVINLSKNEQLLLQSGVKLTLGELFISRVIVALLVLLLGYSYELHFLFAILFMVIGFYLPMLYVKKKRKQRLQKASKQLGEALGTMANSLRAGFSFMQAMNLIANEIDDPLGPEFQKALQEINYGLAVEDAFENLLERLPDKELGIVLNTLIIQRTSGGNLAYLLETMQETIFDRSRVRDEVKTLTAQGKMSSSVITILPIALAVYIRFVNPEYFLQLFSHPLGWVMVISGAISIVLGWFFINKIVQIEV